MSEYPIVNYDNDRKLVGHIILSGRIEELLKKDLAVIIPERYEDGRISAFVVVPKMVVKKDDVDRKIPTEKV